MNLRCGYCGGTMRKKTVSKGNCAGAVKALIVLCIGVAVFILIPVVGWVVGPLICLYALFIGGTTQKIWRCSQCGSMHQRA